jgi:prephenate dehydrogenase
MSTKITIVGLDRAGLSLGLALKKSKNPLECTGFDLDSARMKEAEKSGAVDRSISNLHSAVENADLVIVNLLAGETVEWLAECARSLKDGAVLINTAPIHQSACGWAKTHLPEGRNFLNVTVSINGSYLETGEASDDLFKGGVMLISSLPGTDASAIQLVVDFAAIIGASVMFSDPVEADGLLTQSDLLPRLLLLTYLRNVGERPGWTEAQKLTGPAFWQVYQSTGGFPSGKAAAGEILSHKDNLLLQLDLMVSAIEDLKEELRTADADTLEKELQVTLDSLNKWSNRRTSGDWSSDKSREVKEKAGLWKQLLGIKKPEKKS